MCGRLHYRYLFPGMPSQGQVGSYVCECSPSSRNYGRDCCGPISRHACATDCLALDCQGRNDASIAKDILIFKFFLLSQQKERKKERKESQVLPGPVVGGNEIEFSSLPTKGVVPYCRQYCTEDRNTCRLPYVPRVVYVASSVLLSIVTD